MAIVLDASTALAAVLPDEESAFCESAVATGLKEGIVAPALWAYEVQNGLLIALRRKRLDAESLAQALEALRSFAPDLKASEGISTELRIAQEHGVTAYDAAYLAVARAIGGKLATSDHKLRAAATSAGVRLFSVARSTRVSRGRRA
ncbi:MAG: type II toxin-antitoxin system VapC family toxin [Candidatus Eremiobacteraeota bacterium]|nr:type II toxin-antitoxin system VapC family toxin [Candidatus Eremiobacteraeota bacterium]